MQIISGMFHKNHEGVDRLGLFGMGGSGKTTMCDALCTYFGPSFNQKVYHLKMGSYNRNSVISYKDVYESRQKELLTKLFRLSNDEIDRIPGNKFKVLLGAQVVLHLLQLLSICKNHLSPAYMVMLQH